MIGEKGIINIQHVVEFTAPLVGFENIIIRFDNCPFLISGRGDEIGNDLVSRVIKVTVHQFWVWEPDVLFLCLVDTTMAILVDEWSHFAALVV